MKLDNASQNEGPQTWSVQIGAYKSKTKTNEALQYAKGKLPREFSFVNPVTVPLNTNKGTVYRARLGGMTQAQARKICQYFHDCITVAPINTKTVGQ